MATLAYPYSVRDSTNTSTDNRKTGLTPTVSNGKTLVTSGSPATVLASTVTVIEIGAGDYVAAYDAETNLDASFPVDWGSSLTNPNDRYGTLILTRDSGRVLAALPASGIVQSDVQTIKTQAVTCSAPVAVGPNVGTAQPINFTGTSTSALVKTDVIYINSNPAVGLGGTAQAGAASTITLSASDPEAGGPLTGGWSIELTGGTGAGQSAAVSSYNSSTKVLTISGTWATNPDNTTTYVLHAPVTATASLGTHAPDNWIQSTTFATDAIGAGAVSAAAVTKLQTGLATPTNITGGTITTVTNLTNLPAVPTDWLTAAGVKADAVTKIQAGLSTLAAGAAMALTSGERTTLSGVILGDTTDTLGADILAIKVVTDKLATAVQSDGSGGWQFTVLALAHAPSGSGSDPWALAEPGSYASGTFGYLLSHPDKTGYKLASDGADAVIIETGLNARQALSLIAAASAGVVSGAGTGTVTIKGAGVSTTRIVGSTDSSGNRTAITATPPA